MGMIRIHKAHDMKTHYDTNLGLYQIKYIVLEFQVFFPFYLNDFLTCLENNLDFCIVL